MKLFAVIFLLIAFVLTLELVGQHASFVQTPAGDERSKYVGLRVRKSLPAGLRTGNHFLISSKSGVDVPMDFGIREVSKGKMKMLWFERVAERDAKGVLQWEVLDILILPPMSNSKILATSYCFVGKEYEPEVFGVFTYQDKEYFTRAQRAWRANRLNGKFEEIKVKGVRCENEGWGV